jgi:hypothetical protein
MPTFLDHSGVLLLGLLCRRDPFFWFWGFGLSEEVFTAVLCLPSPNIPVTGSFCSMHRKKTSKAPHTTRCNAFHYCILYWKEAQCSPRVLCAGAADPHKVSTCTCRSSTEKIPLASLLVIVALFLFLVHPFFSCPSCPYSNLVPLQ